MAHINHIRNIDHRSKMAVGDAIQGHDYSFAAFCGTAYQRNILAVNAISHFCGNMGVILLHNNPHLVNELTEIYSLRPELAQDSAFQMPLANNIDSSGKLNTFYDPLYGLTDTEVLDVLSPMSSDSRLLPETQLLRSILTDYLSIIEFQYRKNSNAFGDYPFNLDLLLDLTRMPYSVLNEQVLKYLPANLRSDISSRLSADGAQQKAFNSVLAFSQSMKSTLWHETGFANHTRTSIISTVRRRQLISIYIPESRADVMDYLYHELQHLSKLQIPFLLVESGLSLGQTRLKQLFLSEHSTLPYYTGIIAEDTSSVVSSNNYEKDLSSLFSQTQEMFVFSCSSTLAAKPFSDGIGSYYRNVTDYHDDRHRQPFHIFTSHGHGNVQHEVNQQIINPEELTNLGTGCLLYGKNHQIPILVDNMIL